MDIEQFRKAGYQAIDRICDYYYTLQDKSVVSSVKPGYLRDSLPVEAPEAGEDFQKIADDYQKFIIPGLTHWQHPSFFAFFPTGCTFEGMLADLYASSTMNPGFNSTASDSALIAVVAARSLYQRRHPSVTQSSLVIYTTTQTHSLGLKAGLILGLSVRALEVTWEDKFSLRGETLRKALEGDEREGKKPFILLATVGTTSSGAIDNVSEIGAVMKDYPDLWVHVDAAWAGVALSCPEHRESLHLNAINEHAHSFCTNFHKWGLTNFDASTLWVRDRKYLTDALDVTPPFLRSAEGDAGTVIDYRNWHLALGRR
ncbi:hypothetical protein PLEOSDRAFT_1097003, partial [Pleurotus ostreatus PC15]